MASSRGGPNKRKNPSNAAQSAIAPAIRSRQLLETVPIFPLLIDEAQETTGADNQPVVMAPILALLTFHIGRHLADPGRICRSVASNQTSRCLSSISFKGAIKFFQELPLGPKKNRTNITSPFLLKILNPTLLLKISDFLNEFEFNSNQVPLVTLAVQTSEIRLSPWQAHFFRIFQWVESITRIDLDQGNCWLS